MNFLPQSVPGTDNKQVLSILTNTSYSVDFKALPPPLYPQPTNQTLNRSFSRYEGDPKSFWSQPMKSTRPPFVTNSRFDNVSSLAEVQPSNFSPSLELKTSPLAWILDPAKKKSFTDRVLARLIQSEAHEVNPHLRDDYRQSFITLSLAAAGSPIPFVEASYRMYGVHPDKLWPKIVAHRNWLLGQPTRISAGKRRAVETASESLPTPSVASPGKDSLAPQTVKNPERKRA